MYLHSQLKIIKKSDDGRMAEWLMFGTANPATHDLLSNTNSFITPFIIRCYYFNIFFLWREV